jgi:hypothetical protein
MPRVVDKLMIMREMMLVKEIAMRMELMLDTVMQPQYW